MKILEKLKNKAKKDNKIIAMLIFGSYLNKKEYNDIDICLFTKENTNLKDSKKKIEYQKISDKLDIQVFEQLPLYVKKEIINTGKILLMKDYDNFFDIIVKTNRAYEDYKKYYLDYLEYMKNGNQAKSFI